MPRLRSIPQLVGMNMIDTYMKKMAKLGNLDFTDKKFTNHCVRKTTVYKLQKAGVSNDKIAAIPGHRNEQSLRDYANADPEDHQAISEILSNPHPLQNRTNIYPHPYQSLPPLPKLPVPAVASSTPSITAPLPSIPQYNFTNCTVYFGSSSSNMSCTQLNHTATPPQKKQVIIETESDED